MRFSKAYGLPDARHPDALPGLPQSVYPVQSRHALGYTGHILQTDVTEKPINRSKDFLKSAPPGFTGFIPHKEAESLFGRSFSVVASACAKHGS